MSVMSNLEHLQAFYDFFFSLVFSISLLCGRAFFKRHEGNVVSSNR